MELTQLEERLVQMEATLARVEKAMNDMRRYTLIGVVITVAMIVLPLLIIPFVIPLFLNSVMLPEGF